MIPVSRLKRLLAVLIALAALVGGVALTRVLGDALLRSATGADPTSIFNDVTPVPADLLEAIEWLPDPERDGRAMEPTTRLLITDSYARALSAMDRAGRGDPDAPLADYLSGPALETALAAANDPNAAIAATFHLRQRLRLDVYSDDGSVVAIGVPEVEVVRAIDGAAGRTINTTVEAWRFTMLLEDGNWRIQQLQTTEVEPPEIPGAPRDLETPMDGVNIPTIGGTDHRWTGIDDADVAADLDAAAGFGFETIRVFVAGPEAGAIDVDAFESFLDGAAGRGLSVIPVLFEDSPSHHPTSWHDDLVYLEEIVEPLAGHEAIAAWDLKDQPDLDEPRSGGAVNVDAWLTRVASKVRSLDAETPITIGWSNAEDATRVLNWVDVLSFQYAGPPAGLPDSITSAVAGAAGRPVVVTGFSTPEYRGRLQGMAPALQADAFAALLAAVDRDDLAGAMVGVLRDPAVPDDHGLVTGGASTSSGLLRVDGTERPIADVLRAGPSAIPDATLSERVRSQPLLMLGGLVVVLLIGGALRALLRRKRYERWETRMIAWLEAGMPPTRRGRILRWRRIPAKPERRGHRRLLWWRDRKPWEPPTGEPIDPIALLAEQVLAARAEQDALAEVTAGDRVEDGAGMAGRSDDVIAQPAYGPAFGLAPQDHTVESDRAADDAETAESATVRSSLPAVGDTDDGVWGPPGDIADVDATAVAWVEGALTGMVRQNVDQSALDWVDGEVGVPARRGDLPSAAGDSGDVPTPDGEMTAAHPSEPRPSDTPVRRRRRS